MSDVSGIPYMGPMGQGNFFAPSFSYNPQMSAGQIQSNYMPQASQGQSVLNNLYGGGANAGFGRLTDYYSQLAANQLSGAVYSQGGSNGTYNLAPVGTFSDYNAGGAWPSRGGGGGGGGSLPTGGFDRSILGPDWGPGTGYTSGGLSSGSLGNMPGLGSGGINWGNVGQLAGNLFSQPQQSSPFDFGAGLGAGMFGGLGGSGATPGAGQLDWTHLFTGGGGGGARADPAPGMTMPGGLNSPMSTPQQQPTLDWTGSGARADPAPGMTMPGGLNSPMSTQQQQPIDFGSLFGQSVGGTRAAGGTPFDTGAAPITGTQDTGPYGGSGAGIGGLDTGRAIGAPYTQAVEPQRGMLQEPVTEAYNPYYGVTSPYGQGAGDQAGAPTDTRTGALAPGGGLTAADLGEQARAKLAEIMNGAKEPSPDEVFAGDKPVPTEGQPAVPDELLGEAGRAGMVGRAAATPAAETPAVPAAAPLPEFRQGLGGRQDALNTLKKELQANDLIMTSSYRDPSNPLSRANPNSSHTQGLAFDTRAHTPGEADTVMGQIRELFGARGLVEGRDYRILDEVRNPSGWATGPHVHTAFTAEGMQRYQQNVYQDPNPPRPPADIPYPEGIPLPASRPEEAGPRELPPAAPAADVNRDQEIPRPPADIPAPENIPLPTARPNAAANLAQAHSVLDTNVMDLVRKNAPSSASMVPSSIASQSLREALGNTFTGGMIRSNITPQNLAKAGITQADFDKAYTQGRPSTVGPRSEAPDIGGDWLGNIGKYAGNPFVNSAAAAELPGGAGSYLPAGGAELPGGPGSYFDPAIYGNADPGGAYTLGRDALSRLAAPSGAPEAPEAASRELTGWQPALDAALVPSQYRTADTFRALQNTAANSGFLDDNGVSALSPSAIAMLIQGESRWNPYETSPGGKYRGLTQIGPEQEFYKTIQDMTAAQNIGAYGDWLDYYNVPEKLARAGVDLAALSPSQQAAYLQAIQFGPNATGWQRQFGQGNIDVPVTRAPQAPGMGPGGHSSIPTARSLQQYYARMNANPPYGR